MIVKNQEDVEKLKEIGGIVASCLKVMQEETKAGMSAWDLDQIAKTYLGDHGAKSAPIHCYDFPGQTCISINHQVAHGIPKKDTIIKEGDLINIDVSALKNGYYGDTGGSFQLNPQNPQISKLLSATKAALQAAMNAARANQPINAIGKAIEDTAKFHGYTLIRNLGSHGIGKTLHDEPKFIAGYYDSKDLRQLKENMVITIEPFLSTGATFVDDEGDGWTLVTSPRFRTAQFENTMIIQKEAPPIITTIAK